MFEKKVIMDTNFLLIPGSMGVDVYSEIERIAKFKYKLCMLEGSVKELWSKAEGTSKLAQNARLAIILADAKKVKKLPSKEYVDNDLVEYAKKGAVICTQDRELKDRIKNVKAEIITLKGKSQLIIE